MNWTGLADDTPRLDVKEVSRVVGFEPGALGVVPITDLRGRQRGAVGLRGLGDGVSIGLAAGDAEGAATVPIVYTQQHLGGRRAWWSCPDCRRRCALLFIVPNLRVTCRLCARLPYATEVEDRIGRAAIKVARLRARLGPERRRPRHMRRSKHRDLVDRLDAAEAAFRKLLTEKTRALANTRGGS
jgi:ribosomal protein S27E